MADSSEATREGVRPSDVEVSLVGKEAVPSPSTVGVVAMNGGVAEVSAVVVPPCPCIPETVVVLADEVPMVTDVASREVSRA